MRTIQFRGKTNDEWVYGYFVKKANKSYIVYSNGVYFEVFPESVGQFTGKYDINGEPIFEGDLVLCAKESNGKVYGQTLGEVFFDAEYHSEIHGEVGFWVAEYYPTASEFSLLSNSPTQYYRIVGNMYEDNDVFRYYSEFKDLQKFWDEASNWAECWESDLGREFEVKLQKLLEGIKRS